MTGEQRKLAAILCADVVGYSRLIGMDEMDTLTRLKAVRADVIDPSIAEFGGRLVKTTGDGLLVEFRSVVDATRCAISVQQQMMQRNTDAPADRRITFRIGIHMGDVVIEGEDILGDGVNVAARLEALATPGGVCVSGRVQEDLAGKLDVELRDGGEQSLKNIARPVRVWHWPHAIAPRSPLQEPTASRSPVAPDKPSIAVLPFDNLSADPEQAYFSDGMAEDLITDLSKIQGLSVAARHSSFSFKGQMPDVSVVAERLGVAFVLEGSVRKMGNRLRINAQLIETARGRHIWAERYDGDVDDIFDFQDRIRAQIVSSLALSLTPSDVARTQRKRTGSVDAYDLYLKGRTRYFSYAPDDNLEAGRLFEAAIEIDPQFAEAYTYLGMCYVNAWLFLWPGFDAGLARAIELARAAVAMAPDLAVAHLRLGWVELFLRQHEAARTSFERALSLEPENAEIHAYFAEALNYSGEYQSAAEHAAEALRLDPLSPPSWQFIHGRSFYHLGQYDRAKSLISQAVERVPALTVARLFLACTYVEMNRLVDAKEQIRRLIEMEPRYTLKVADRVYPFRLAAERQRFIDALRAAGLPG